MTFMVHDVHGATYKVQGLSHGSWIMGVLGFQLMQFGHIFGESVFFWLIMCDGQIKKCEGCGVKLQINVEERGPRVVQEALVGQISSISSDGT